MIRDGRAGAIGLREGGRGAPVLFLHGLAGTGAVVVLLIAALFTGAAGCVLYVLKLRISPDTAFGVADWTAPIIVMVVLGGLGSLPGVLLGDEQVAANRGTAPASAAPRSRPPSSATRGSRARAPSAGGGAGSRCGRRGEEGCG